MANHKCARCGVADNCVHDDSDWGSAPYFVHVCTLDPCQIAALKRENAALRAREERVAIAYQRWSAAQSITPADDAAAFAAFRSSPDYPKEQADG